MEEHRTDLPLLVILYEPLVKVETTGQRDFVYFGFIFVSVCSLLHSNWKENKLKRKIPSLLPPSEPQYENLVSTADSLS